MFQAILSSLEKYILPYKTLIQITDLSKKFGVFLDTPFYLTQQFCSNSKGISLSHFYDIKPINQIGTGEIARFPNLLKFDLDMLIYSMQIPDLRSKQNPIVLTVLLKGKYQKKCQWIPSPKYILTLVSYNPKSESGVFLKCQIITISQ